MSAKACLLCGITKAEINAQRRYNKRNLPCLTTSGRHKYTTGRKAVKINPNQAELAVKYQN